MDLSVLEQDYLAHREAFAGSPIFYAVKANPHEEVLRRFDSLGAGFEISSLGELQLVRKLGIPAHRVISSNPVKAPAFVAEAYAYGMRHFALDSEAEIAKLAELAPGSEVLVRLTVPNDSSEWPLDRKFGVEAEEALRLLIAAKQQGLHAIGVTFHVGSQCREAGAWTIALEKAASVWSQGLLQHLPLRVLNIGGGIPAEYTSPLVPSVDDIAQEVNVTRTNLFPAEVETWLEPGRALVARAGVMFCSVLGVARRNGIRWVYLDAGVFHGLTEAMGGIAYRIVTEAPGPDEPCTIAGPSCDSVDVIAHGVPLPRVRVGERVAILAAGAYTTSYASHFNGFPPPRTSIFETAAHG